MAVDRKTLAAYDQDAAAFAREWHDQPAPRDLQEIVERFFVRGGNSADIGCGSGREVAWLNANGFSAAGFDASEGLLALKDGKFVVLRVPYPTGFYTKWMDGRIDDPRGGWKGRGIYATVSTRAPFHMETGKGTTSKVAHFQMRPDPLAK